VGLSFALPTTSSTSASGRAFLLALMDDGSKRRIDIIGLTPLACQSVETFRQRVRARVKVDGDDPRMRIALCGYEGEHKMPDSWTCHAWKARGGYGSQSADGNENPHKERIWFSPHCLEIDAQPNLFETKAEQLTL